MKNFHSGTMLPCVVCGQVLPNVHGTFPSGLERSKLWFCCVYVRCQPVYGNRFIPKGEDQGDTDMLFCVTALIFKSEATEDEQTLKDEHGTALGLDPRYILCVS